MENFYPGVCGACGTHVEALAGTRARDAQGDHVTLCAPCGERHARTIRFSAHNDSLVALTPAGWLGDSLALYRDALTIGGARFDRDVKLDLCSFEALPRVVASLRSAGFHPVQSRELVAVLQARTERIAAFQRATETRAQEIDARLQTKGHKLYPYQRFGASWLSQRQAGLLCDEMGLGKTAQVLCALPDDVPIVVVAPAVAKGVWFSEIVKWRPDLLPVCLSGMNSFRWPVKGEVVILNYDILSDSIETPAPAGVFLVADEGHALKNWKSRRTRRWRVLRAACEASSPHVWIVTATPLLNQPGELWTLCNVAGCATEAFGTWARFRELFHAVDAPFGGIEWGDPDPIVPRLLSRVCLRRLRQEVLPELPTKTYQRIDVEIHDSFLASIAREWKAMGMVVPDLSRRNDPEKRVEFDALASSRRILASAKVHALLGLIAEYEDANESLVVFSAHRGPIDTLSHRPGWAAITGDTPNEQRDRIAARFQNGELKGIAATIQAGGVAITLTHASHMVFVDRTYTPAINSQAEDRVCRIGQSRGVVVIDLVANHPLDTRLFEILTEKQDMTEGAIETHGETVYDG